MRFIVFVLAVLFSPWTAAVGAETKKTGRPRGNLKIPGGLSGKSHKLVVAAEEAYQKAFHAESGRERLFKTAERKLLAATRDEEAGKTALPHFRLGAAYRQMMNYDEARPCLERAIELNPRFYQAHVLLAEVLAKQGKVEKALESYDECLEIYPRYRRALKGKVDALIRAGQFKEAIATAEKTLKNLNDPKKDPGPELVALIVYLKRELKGREWKYIVETENYKIFTDVSEELAAEIGKHVELIRRAYMVVFPDIKRPSRKYEIFLHKNKQAYHEAGGPPGAGGHYSPLLRRLEVPRYPKMKDTTLVLYHEAFHQFLHEYLELAPQWFNEGLGDYFGPFQYHVERGGKEYMRSRPNPWRLNYIKLAIRARRTPAPGELMLMSRAEMYGQNVGIHYAMAWSLIYFMIEQGQYRKILIRYWQELRKGKGIDVAYKNSFGRINMARFEKEWKDYTLRIDARGL